MKLTRSLPSGARCCYRPRRAKTFHCRPELQEFLATSVHVMAPFLWLQESIHIRHIWYPSRSLKSRSLKETHCCEMVDLSWVMAAVGVLALLYCVFGYGMATLVHSLVEMLVGRSYAGRELQVGDSRARVSVKTKE